MAVEVIPGITAGIAAPAVIGVPVTDRRYTPGVAFVTGHTKEGGRQPDWHQLARCGLTLVVYMGVSQCEEITRALIAGGLAPSTPAAAIQAAHTDRQRSHVTSLGRLAREIREAGIGSPAILVIGDVVRLADIAVEPLIAEGFARRRLGSTA